LGLKQTEQPIFGKLEASMDVPAGVACRSESLSESRPRLAVETTSRRAMSQGMLGSLALSDLHGRECLRPETRDFSDSLFNSIERMIYRLCNDYSSACNERAEDLVQDCVLNISKQIRKYNPELSNFTTWCWHLCKNTLINKIRRVNRRIVLCGNCPESLMTSYSKNPTKVFTFEIREAVHDLLKQNPKQKQMVFAMFGNPRAKHYFSPDKIEICQVARTCNVPYQEAYLFYRNIVRPFFKKRFAE
jgi:RNA polymerase sigma factor (sigma-70 family)